MKPLRKIFILSLIMTVYAFSQWVSITDSEGTPVSAILIEDTPEGTVIEFTTPGYYLNTLMIKGKTYSALSAPKTALFLEKGYPELLRFNESIIIPDEAKMNYEILEVEYDTTCIEPIAPSKGSLLRSIDPETVPYTFDKVYDQDIY